jgi:hypothetical protein
MQAKTRKKILQLGMPQGTASHRLLKDVLFALLCEAGRNVCFHCSKPMTRGAFSIEHKTPWLDSEDPVRLFFAQSNIAFSHLGCNVAARRGSKLYASDALRRAVYFHRRWTGKSLEERRADRRRRYAKYGC